MCCIGFFIDSRTQPGELLGNARTNERGVLTNSGSEYERVDPTQGRGQHADIEPHAVAEIIECKCRLRVAAGLQLADVIADPGEAFEPALAIQEILHGPPAHPFLLDQIEDHAGIDLARTGAHGYAIERGKSHRALDAASSGERAHGGAAAQVSDNNAPARHLGRDLGQPVCYVFLREPMKDVATLPTRLTVQRD